MARPFRGGQFEDTYKPLSMTLLFFQLGSAFVHRSLTGTPSYLRTCVLFTLLSVVLVTPGCSRRETSVQIGNREQILHRGVGPEVADLDPHLGTGVTDYNVLTALFEGLVTEDPVDLHPVPGVAERWEVASDGLTYTFYLRSSAKWSNGEPVTAQDFIASFRRILTPSLGADNASLLHVIRNAEAFHQGRLTDFAEVGLTAPDAHTLRIVLDHADAGFLSLLTYTPFFPVHLPTIEKYGPSTSRGNPWARPDRLVGNGPFVLKEWKAGQKIIVAKSSTYWDAQTVKLNEIHFYSIDDRDAEERAFRSGQLHLTETLPSAKVDTYRQAQSHVLRIDPYLGTEFYRLNVKKPFLNDRRVRRALALAIDRSAIAGNLLRGGQQAAQALTPPNTAGYTPRAALPYDPNAAREALAEAGFPGGKGTPPLQLLYNTSETHRAVAEAVQEMWRRELGLEVKLLNQENKMLLSVRRAGDFEVLRSVWTADTVDPLSFLNVFTSSSGNNYTGWSNPAYDQLLFQAARTPDATARDSLLQKAEALLLDDTPIIPIYHYTHVFLLQPSVRNWHPTLLDHHPYKYVYLEAP